MKRLYNKGIYCCVERGWVKFNSFFFNGVYNFMECVVIILCMKKSRVVRGRIWLEVDFYGLIEKFRWGDKDNLLCRGKN